MNQVSPPIEATTTLAPHEDVSRVIIVWHAADDVAVIDDFNVPPKLRGKGLGKKAYEAWEERLGDGFKLVRLFAANTDGIRRANGFWEAMGFDYATRPGSDTDVTEYEDFWWVMRKGVNGNPTPEPHVYDSPCHDDEEEEHA